MAGKTYLNLLSLLMLNRVYDSKTITIQCGNEIVASKYRKKLIEEGHAKKQTLVLKEGKQRSVTIFTLTKKGFQFLTQHDKNITYALCTQDMGEDIPLKSDFETKATTKLRLIRRTKAITVASKAGAMIPLENYTIQNDGEERDQDNDYSMSDYIAETLEEKDYHKIDPYREKNVSKEFVFHTDAFIKQNAGAANKLTSVQDSASGRYSGVADSELKSILLYVAPVYGMSWTKWLAKREMPAFSIWTKTKAIASPEQLRRSGTCAALIVDNAKRFHDLYKNTDNAKVGEDASFGDPFKHFYIIPADNYGVQHLRWLLSTNDDEINSSIMESAVDSGMYRKNTSFTPSLFPLLNADDEPVAINFQFDAKHLQRIESVATKNPSTTFNLLCYDWQEDYYKRILPTNINIIPLPMSN